MSFDLFRSKVLHSALAAILIGSVFGASTLRAQSVDSVPSAPPQNTAPSDTTEERFPFSVETIKIEGGAELVTIFYKTNGTFDNRGPEESKFVPLLSVLRDTLGDEVMENDRLRHVWMLTYTKPSTMQKLMAAIPFNYRRWGSKREAGKTIPPPIMDLNGPNGQIWDTILWQIIRRGYAGPVGDKLKMYWGPIRQNTAEYKRTAIAEALTILSLYEQVQGERVFTDQELLDIKTRLALTEKPFGGQMQKENYLRANDRDLVAGNANQGQTRELLRRFTEAQDLYFEPLEMVDGKAKHAISWVFKEDLEANKDRVWEGRFLNIKSPWDDKRLLDWKGYSEVRWFDAESREVEPNTPGAISKTLIPLAIYGLDHPHVPIILVDFRDTGNPKKREMTKRAFDDVMGNVLSFTKGGGIALTLGKLLYGFVLGRRGTDMNQPSRLRSYSQLKMILAMDESLNEEFRRETAKRLDKVSINPLENDLEAELRLARGQYKNLVEYAKSPEGLRLKLEKDRIQEMTLAKHGGKMPLKYSIAQMLTFGLYKYRVKPTTELAAKADLLRQLAFHERKIRETAYYSVRPEVDSNVAMLMRSLNFVAQKGQLAGGKTAKAVAKIFAGSFDDGIRTACLAGLYKINNSTARKELLAIRENQRNDARWRETAAEYLRKVQIEREAVSKRSSVVAAESQ
ncbi:MAG TPA: hypothetical protein VJ781_02475 [Pyrinomonadaceae bacterium]|nr:hypothetical protein [Pyrinomonadaceae bacterium]